MIINFNEHELEFDDELVTTYEYEVCDDFARAAITRLHTNFHENSIEKIFAEHSEEEVRKLIIDTAKMEIALYQGRL